MPESCVPAARVGGIAAAVAGLALLAAATGCGSSGGSGKTSDSKPAGTSDSKTAGPAKGIQLPVKIASLKKTFDDGSNYYKDSGIPASVRKDLHSVFYIDGADSEKNVTVSGGVGLPVPSDGPSDRVKALFTKWEQGVAGKPTSSVTTGSAGGSAECTRSGSETVCGWVNGKTALTFNFTGFGEKRAIALVPQILSAMVRP
jgi:hypothetical protein